MTEVISVRFRNGCKEYYFDPKGLTVPTDTDVIVETAQGPEFARCSLGNHQVEDDAVVKPLRGLIRIATDNDRHTAAYNRGREKEAFEVCKKKIQQHKLEMKLVRVECSFDGSKILFFFTADGRVDFRELVKDLAGVFRARIELRQIGVRDEAKMIGGLGICGRPFCCSQFMDEFLPVSIKMAKTQSLSLNPTKIYHEPLAQAENVEFRWNSTVSALLSGDRLTGVRLRDTVTGKESVVNCDGVFVSVGRQPATALAVGQLALDGGGYIVAGETTETSIPGVYAVGDVRTKPLRQVVTAVADGAVAVHMAEKYIAENR